MPELYISILCLFCNFMQRHDPILDDALCKIHGTILLGVTLKQTMVYMLLTQ